MRWIRYSILGLLFILGIYTISMCFVDESKSFTVVKEVNYPLEKVYPQFNNFQNFTRWNQYFRDSETISIDFFAPYEGQNSSIAFYDKTDDKKGEMFIRYENPYKTLRYQLFEKQKDYPYLIDVRFKVLSPQKTKIIWNIHTPKLSWMKRSMNLMAESDFVNNIDKSIRNLHNILSNKVDKDELLTSIKFDSIMVEKKEGELLLGVNISTSNKGNMLYKNIILNHNKVLNFVMNDLNKQEDEIGLPTLITDANNYKDKEVSYFYGIPLSKRISVSDNNFNFKTVNTSTFYTVYFQGNYKERIQPIQSLLQKAKKDSMRYGELHQTFLEFPEDNEEVKIKFSLPVYK